MTITDAAKTGRKGVSDIGKEPTAGVDLQRWPEMGTPKPAPIRAAVAKSVLRRVARRAGLRVELPDGSHLGPATAPALRISSPRSLFTRLGRDGKIGFGEAYMAGDWDAPDLAAAIEPLARDVGSLVPRPLQWIRRFYDARHPAAENNDRRGARRNIARHYDLSNDLFALFLDETMTYSAALFERSVDEPLSVAQHRKIDRLLDEAGVRHGSRVLEIGTGWGELAIRAARRGALVRSVTLSTEQLMLARERIAEAGCSDMVEVELCDYREVGGEYDAVVSVEMIEAVGHEYWPTYFAKLDELLAPGGRAVVQAITMPHDRMLATRRTWTWINKYIFPGGFLPSTEAIEQITRDHTGLRVTERFAMGRHYARTLATWDVRFAAAHDRIAALGFDRTFERMWHFYLCYSQAGFASGYLDVQQILLTRESR